MEERIISKSGPTHFKGGSSPLSPNPPSIMPRLVKCGATHRLFLTYLVVLSQSLSHFCPSMIQSEWHIVRKQQHPEKSVDLYKNTNVDWHFLTKEEQYKIA